MPYMEGLVLESVRMMMGRCFGIPHRALRDTTLAGYNIPKVCLNIFIYKHLFLFTNNKFINKTINLLTKQQVY